MHLPNDKGETIPLTGILLLAMVCFLWGGNIVSIRVSNQYIPPLMAAAARSAVAAILLWAYARLRGEPVFLKGEHFRQGVVIGVLFALDFTFLYLGLAYTTASRAVIFLYTHPLWTALGAHFLLKDDRLTTGKAIGLIVAFGGLVSVFGSRPLSLGPLYWLGDLFEVGAALSWAATTIYLKRFIRDRPITHYQTLFAQLLLSVPILAVCSLIMESVNEIRPTGLMAALLAYQSVVVAFFSYLLWFWMLHRFPATRLAAFSFLTPLFGVILGGLLLHEPLSLLLWTGLAMVAAGIYLVNRPQA